MFFQKIYYFPFLVIAVNFEENDGIPLEKIVGGWPAHPGEFPYQVSLRVKGRHICGGSIISNLHILTAAHCLQEFENSYKSLSIVSGSNKLFQGGQFHKICTIAIHPEYKSGPEFAWHNDIAIITLTKSMTFNSFQNKIKLPSRNLKIRSEGIISGWGLIFPNFQTVPNELQKLRTTVCPSSFCDEHFPFTLHREQICAIQQTGSGACSGDSGGPLVVNKEIVGIASWVVPCARGFPDVYTNVFSYKDFIVQEMKRSDASKCGNFNLP